MATAYKTLKRCVLIGAQGMLGTMLQKRLTDFEVITHDRSQLDITNRDQVLTQVSELQPDIVINAAAYTAVDDCETHREQAMVVNGDAPGYIAEAAKAVDAYVVHYSTDYVFNGQNQAGYDEYYSDIDPINAYGVSKAAGEKAIQEQADDTWQKYYIIRTAWLYGPGGSNFVDTMLKLARERDTLTVVNDQTGSPTYTFDLADRTQELLRAQLPGGVYHITNSGSCTWYEFAKEIFQLTHIDIDLQACSSEEFPRPARRPRYSILVNSKLPVMPTWQNALSRFLE